MKIANPPCVDTAGSRIVTSNTRRYRANDTQNHVPCKLNFTGGGVYSRSHSSVQRKVKKIIVSLGSYAPNLAYWLLNVFGLRGV